MCEALRESFKTRSNESHSYKSDADMSDEQILEGLREISAISLDESTAYESRKYRA